MHGVWCACGACAAGAGWSCVPCGSYVWLYPFSSRAGTIVRADGATRGVCRPPEILRINLLCLVFAGWWSVFWRSKLKLLWLSFAMSGTTKPQSYDARVYTVCAPWAGARGDAFIRIFQPDCLNGLDNIADAMNGPLFEPMRRTATWEGTQHWEECRLALLSLQLSSDRPPGHDPIVPTS